MPSRRDVLKAAAMAVPAVSIGSSALGAKAQGPRVVVVGAGAFGGWTALELVRRGARVTLIDAWGPGHARASSGGETRVIRTSYGTRAVYTKMATRALELWRAHDERFGRRFFRNTGALWMFGTDDSFGRASADAVRAAGLQMDELPRKEAERRYPQIDFTGIQSIVYEPAAGLLLARRACEHVVERLIAEGGEYQQTAIASPVRVTGARPASFPMLNGRPIAADIFVFACGPWLATLFPDVVGKAVQSTRQEVYYFGTPPGDERYSEGTLPVWVDFGERLLYGIPGNANRGFKVADDTSGPPMEPTSGQRDLTDAGVAAARSFLARRFPALAQAPLLGGEVCQYEASPDSHFIVDRHPGVENVWIVGGGSGHGFKMGPAMGELVASLVLGTGTLDPTFSLARFARAAGHQQIEKWI